MEETEIDSVLADDLGPNDMVRVASGLVTIVKRLEDELDENADYIRVLADDGEEYVFKWDEMVSLYGY
jgi:hypothetical protein